MGVTGQLEHGQKGTDIDTHERWGGATATRETVAQGFIEKQEKEPKELEINWKYVFGLVG